MRYFLKYYRKNQNGVSINVDKKVSAAIMHFSTPSECTEQSPAVVRELFKIEGVGLVTIYPYEIYVRKGDIFGWKELMGAIVNTIGHALHPDGEITKAREAYVVDLNDQDELPIDPTIHVE